MKEEIVNMIQQAAESFRRRRKTPDDSNGGVGVGRLLIVADTDPAMNCFLEDVPGVYQAVVLRLPGAVTPQPEVELARAISLMDFYRCQKVVLFIGNKNSKVYYRLSQLTNEETYTINDWKEAVIHPEMAVLRMMRWVENFLGERGQRDFAVMGLLLDTNSGDLQWLGEHPEHGKEKLPQALEVAAEPVIPQAGTEPFPDLPLPSLPEIQLPPIPELDLSVLESVPPPARPKKISYGLSGGGQGGPISFEQMLAQMPPQITIDKLNAGPLSVEEQKSQAEHHAQLAAKPSVQAVPDVKPERILQEATPKQAPPAQTITFSSSSGRARLVTIPEQPQKTPVVVVRKPQKPLHEPEYDLENGQGEQELPQVRLEQGFITMGGLEQPIDPALQKALMRVKNFYLEQFSMPERQRLCKQIRMQTTAGSNPGELLKLIIVPVLKLGSKRYAVINDLLIMKEKLPSLQPLLVQALLEEILVK
jgi:hypothetical protein